MTEAPEDHLADLLIESIESRLTESRSQELAELGRSNPGVGELISDFENPEILREEMEAFLRISARKAYRRWRKQRLRKKRRLAAEVLVTLSIGALVVWLWRPGAVNLSVPAALSFEEKPLAVGGENDYAVMRVLPDGTKVWLNSQSKLIFPARFSGDERVVEIRGEGYFEVVGQTEPFVVKAGGVQVRVLGTRFDVKAYPDDDSVRMTLVDGAVEVWKGTGKPQMIKAGEEMAVARGSVALPAPRNVDWSRSLAWKDNAFYFPPHTRLRAVLRQISEWYSLQPEYHGRIPDQEEEYGGRISRSLPLKTVLSDLQFPGVSFRVDGNRLIVESNKTN